MRHIHRILFYLGAGWETGRFLFLFILVSLAVNPAGNPLMGLLLLWLSAGQLCTGILFFLGAYAPRRFFSLGKIIAVFKFIGILPPLVYITAGILAPGILSSGRQAAIGLPVPAAVLFVDFIFLIYLILFAPDSETRPEET